MASTFTLNTAASDGRYLSLSCTQTKDIANNRSTISWTLSSLGGSDTYYSIGPTNVYINGVNVYSKERVNWDERIFPAAKGSVSGTTTVNHDTLGNKSITVSISTAIEVFSVSTVSNTWTLDQIPRKATITAAPNFSDEDNPTITYSNPATTNVSSLQACISLTGAVADIPYRDISKTGTSYTFNLTTAERNTLRNATTTAKSRTVYFFVKTVINGTTYTSTLAKTLTITNANPTISPTITDSNSATVALTGSADTLVKYYSNAAFTINASALKGATITATKISCGGKSSTASSGTLSAVESGKFVVSATDSRGNTASQTINKTFVDYVKLTCNLTTNNISPSGSMPFSVEGNCYNGSFGAQANTLTVQYRYKTASGEYGDWVTVTATKSGNTYTAEGTLTGLDYRQEYVFQARAVDKLAAIPSDEQNIHSIPVFDWSKEDFNFNVPLKYQNANMDFVVDYGTDGDWTYRKWFSGIAECWQTTEVTTSITTAAGSFYESTSNRATYPTNLFISEPVCHVTPSNASAAYAIWIVIGRQGTASQTAAWYFCAPLSRASVTVTTSISAKGRWK